eukprot:16432462-Heterocapsa_arctica.AAC.1
MGWSGQGKGYPGSSADLGWTCQACGTRGNWNTKAACRVCYEPHPLLAKGQKGKGKHKNKVGKYPQTDWDAEYALGLDYAMSKEDTEHVEFKRGMAKLQSAERALTAIDYQEESLKAIRKKIKEIWKKANGGEDQSREDRAQALLSRKVSKVNKKKYVKQQLQIHSKKLMELQT